MTAFSISSPGQSGLQKWSFNTGDAVEFNISYEVYEPIDSLNLVISFTSAGSDVVVTSVKEAIRAHPLEPGEAGEIKIEIPSLPFRPGEFELTLGLGSNDFGIFEDILDANVNMPHLVIEGMVLAGLCTGARRGYFYIRHEYQEQEDIIRGELSRAYQNGFLGKNILGTELSFEITLFVSPGGYICGEETALLEAIEGKRAEPRSKPPFMAAAGLWGKPTVINHVETLAFAADRESRSGHLALIRSCLCH